MAPQATDIDATMTACDHRCDDDRMRPGGGGGGGGGWMHRRFGRDDLAKGYKLAPGTIRRALKLAAKYRATIVAYLLVLVVSSFLGVAPALIVRSLIDDAIVPRRGDLVGRYAVAGFVRRRPRRPASASCRATCRRASGEGLIFDLRVKLFDHVQRMPLAFFTRTQTGALISRLNNDVIGAQNAVTNTLGSVVSSVITLGITIAAMLVLSWQITLLALFVLPLFLLPSKRAGRRLQRLSRDQMNLNAGMNATMQERFNVSGAMLAKLFGRPDAERTTSAPRPPVSGTSECASPCTHARSSSCSASSPRSGARSCTGSADRSPCSGVRECRGHRRACDAARPAVLAARRR